MTTTNTELRSFPPVNAAIDAVKNVDWDLMKERSRRDIHQIGKVLTATGEFISMMGIRLTEV